MDPQQVSEGFVPISTGEAEQLPTLSPEEILEQFNAEEERLKKLLATLNVAFEEKLATLATKQLITKMTQRTS